MRRAARQEYEQKYTVETNYGVLMAIYERALGCAIEVDESDGPATALSKELIAC